MTTETIKRIPVNGTRLRAARLALGLGTRKFARAAGTGFVQIDSIEKEGFVSSTTTLAELRRLASAAGLTLADLLDAPSPEPRLSTESQPAADAAILGGILASDLRLQPLEDIADVTGWTLPRVRTAMEMLDKALEPAGMRVHETFAMICVRPRHPDALTTADLMESRRGIRFGMRAPEGRLLYEALNNRQHRLTRGERPYLGRLTRLGIMRNGHRGEPFAVITEDAAYAFDVPPE